MLGIQPQKPRQVCSNGPWACLQGEKSFWRSITACLMVEVNIIAVRRCLQRRHVVRLQAVALTAGVSRRGP